MTTIGAWQEKEVIDQILAEIKHYLNPVMDDTETKEFLMGMCAGLHAALDSQPAFVSNKEYLGAVSWAAIEALKYKKPQK